MASELSSSSSELKPAPAERKPQPRSARSMLSLLPIMLPVAAIVFIADRVTKSLAESELSKLPAQSVDVIGSVLRFSLSHNTGAAFGVLQNSAILYLVIALVVIVVSVGYYRYLPRNNNLLTVCLDMQLGGAVGNLVNRFLRVSVVDLLDLGISAQ